MNYNSGYKINKTERNRTFIIFIIFGLWALVISAFLIKLQIFNYGKYVAKVRAQSNRIFKLHPKRGTIYDVNGEILAISVKTKSLFINNKKKEESKVLFNDLKKKILIGYKKARDIKRRIKRGDNFIWVKRKLSLNEIMKLSRMKKNTKYKSTIGFLDEYKRIYPQKESASHIIGGVGIDEQGLSGIEYEYDSKIMGKGGKVEVLTDAKHRVFSLKYIEKPIQGKDIYLTIDHSIQYFVERELIKTVKKHQAKGGTVIVMNPRDGQILAMASYPFFNPDRIGKVNPNTLKNKAISFLYSPGSTFKIILAASALENDICYPQQVFNCYNGVYKIKNRTIYDVHPYSKLTFEDVIIKSSNIGAAMIGQRIGKRKYYNSILEFGFGSKTGIGLPGEERGILNPLKKWSQVSIAYLSHGYEISVTPIQMVRAFNVVASGGYLIRPQIISKIRGDELRKDERVKILDRATLKRVTRIMTDVVNYGTGKKTRIAGIDVAGKTGTAKKFKWGQYRKIYISSFGGFFPADNPRVTMFVVIDEPKNQFYGGDVAAPLFKSIAEKLLIYLRIFPELDEKNEVRI